MNVKNISKDKFIFFMGAVVLLVFASFLDLGISVALYDPNTVFGRFFENHVLLIVFLPVIYAALALFKMSKNYTYFAIGILISLYAGFENTGSYYSTVFTRIGMGVFVSLIIFCLMLGVVLFTKDDKIHMQRDKYQKVLLYFMMIVGVIHLIKLLNGRIRFRDFKEYIEYSEFTNWYQIRLFGPGSSFPSGHTSTLYVLLPILTIYGKDKLNVRIVAYVFVALMAFSRIRIGAHFLSDTMAAIVIAMIVEFLIDKFGVSYFERALPSL